MALRFLLPPSTGSARARARGEMLQRVLERELGEAFDVRVANDYRELDAALVRGEAELAWAPAAVLADLEARHASGIRSVFKVMRGGRSTYRSAVVVHVDAPYRTVKDLRDARPGWVDPLSLGGCLLALDHLRQRGLLPSELGKPRYFGTHPAALAALAARETDVGAVSVVSPFDEDVRAALELHAGPAARHLRSLAVTAAAPTDGVVITDVLPLARVEQVERALFLPADSALCVAMEIDGFERAAPGEYAELTRLFPDR